MKGKINEREINDRENGQREWKTCREINSSQGPFSLTGLCWQLCCTHTTPPISRRLISSSPLPLYLRWERESGRLEAPCLHPYGEGHWLSLAMEGRPPRPWGGKLFASWMSDWHSPGFPSLCCQWDFLVSVMDFIYDQRLSTWNQDDPKQYLVFQTCTWIRMIQRNIAQIQAIVISSCRWTAWHAPYTMHSSYFKAI